MQMNSAPLFPGIIQADPGAAGRVPNPASKLGFLWSHNVKFPLNSFQDPETFPSPHLHPLPVMLASQSLRIRAEETDLEPAEVVGRVRPDSQEVLGTGPGSATGSVLPGMSHPTSLPYGAPDGETKRGVKVPSRPHSLQKEH